MSMEKEREGGEIVQGAEECERKTKELLEEMGFPSGILPLKNIVECGRVMATGFVWMKQKKVYEHQFVGSNTRVRYGVEITGFVERLKMKKMTGVRSRHAFVWVPITEMRMDGSSLFDRIYFSTPLGLGRSFPVSAFFDKQEEEEEKGCLLLRS